MFEFSAVVGTSVDKESIVSFKTSFLDVDFEAIKMSLFTVHNCVTFTIIASFVFDVDPKYKANMTI